MAALESPMQANVHPYGDSCSKEFCLFCLGQATEMPNGEVLSTSRPVQFVTALELREAGR